MIHPTIELWQSQHREIGMLEFFDSADVSDRFPYYPIENDFICIAIDETNAVCVRPNGTVCELDSDEAGRIVCECARDQTAFVTAMSHLDQHFEKCDDDDYADDIADATRDQCIKMAGGNAYTEFFTSLLGV